MTTKEQMKEYYQKNKERIIQHVNKMKKIRREETRRNDIIDRLNAGGYLRLPYVQMKKYNIILENDKYC